MAEGGLSAPIQYSTGDQFAATLTRQTGETRGAPSPAQFAATLTSPATASPAKT